MEFILKTIDGNTETFDDEKEFRKAVRKQKKLEDQMEAARYENQERAKRENALSILDLIERLDQEGQPGMANYTFINRSATEASNRIWDVQDIRQPMTFHTSTGFACKSPGGTYPEHPMIPGDRYDIVLTNIRDEVVALHSVETNSWIGIAICGGQFDRRRFPKSLEVQVQELYAARGGGIPSKLPLDHMLPRDMQG